MIDDTAARGMDPAGLTATCHKPGRRPTRAEGCRSVQL